MSNSESLAIRREVLVAIDSLLSCLKHRHNHTMRAIGELDEIEYLATEVRKITELTSNDECNCVESSVNRIEALRGHGSPSNHPEFASWICPQHGYKRL